MNRQLFVALIGMVIFSGHVLPAKAQFRPAQQRSMFAPAAPPRSPSGGGGMKHNTDWKTNVMPTRPGGPGRPLIDPYRGHGQYNPGPDIKKLIDAVGGRIAKDAQNNRRYDDNYDYAPQPPRTVYVPQPQQPAYVAPAPPPPRNVVVPKRAPKNVAFKLAERDSERMLAELDARQGNEIAKAEEKLDAAIEAQLNDPGVSGPDKQAIEQALADANEGKFDKLDAILGKPGSTLPPNLQKTLEARAELGKYGEGLLAGDFNDRQKEARLDRIGKLIDNLPPGSLQTSLQGNFGKMRKYNDLSTLVALTQGNNDSLQTLVTGSENAGFGPEFVAEISGLPVMGTEAVADSKVAATDILLLNDPDSELPISYSLGTHGYTMQPGEKQALTKSYVVSFQTESGGTTKQYTLANGVYRFVQTSQGWDLSKDEPKVVIDNSEYNGPFGYLVNGKPFTLAAGESKEHRDTKAIAIEFDRGNGVSTRKLVSTGTYRVGIDPEGALLDLYEVDDATANSGATIATSATRKGSASNSKARQIEEALARLKAKQD